MPFHIVLEVDGLQFGNAKERRQAILNFLRTVVDTNRVVAAGRYGGFYELPIYHAELHVTDKTRKLPQESQPFNPDDNTTGE